MRLLPRTDAVSVDPEEAQILVSQAFVSQCFQVFTVTVIAYDIMTTMDNEIKYFWKTPIKMPTLVYFANRYIGLLGAVFYSFFNTLDASPALHLNASSLRIVLSREGNIIISESSSGFGSRAQDGNNHLCRPNIVFDSFYSRKDTAGEIGGNIRICGFIGSEPVQWGMAGWIVPLIYAAILMTMALYKAAEFWRLSSGLTGFTLVKVLVVDQFLYFVTKPIFPQPPWEPAFGKLEKGRGKGTE
ncbi:uncharacterized protein FOMMEDRAFT_160910 [Fomitiporia mediterranea MF3/22]|uniref:uncharacterized protein n=1 Tax=Fomitiporia mediterranea (strain MF3/22) TaxID=694068 RepID=UPI0004407DBC|nr:uncharacterized protein FOMMEDRAFT_160910 [Fomitiporia mediterranea MF3/22]EJC99305.1 hypothetical protein FOMMEDRAFT_160910 [Fomitiporia mediterranea MF3/22]